MYSDPGLITAEESTPYTSPYGLPGPVAPSQVPDYTSPYGLPGPVAPSLIPQTSTPTTSENIVSAIPQAISNLTKGLTPGPSPRVGVPVTSSLFSPFSSTGLPSWFWLAAAGIGLVLLMPTGRRR